MKLKNFFSIANTFPSELNKKERKTQILALWVLIVPFLFVFYICFDILMNSDFVSFIWVSCLLLVGMTVMIYYWDELDEKYGLNPINSPFSLSYQGYVILLTVFSPTFFLGMVCLGFAKNNFWFGLGGAVAIVYPVIGMFLRINTFNDDSIVIFKNKSVLPDKVVLLNGSEFGSGEKEGIKTVKGFGYMPISYWILATALGFYTVGLGFSDIHLHFANGSPSLEAAVFIIILGLLVQSVYLFPDKLNRVVPIDLRTKNGFWFMFVLVFVLFGVSQWLIGIVTALT